MIETIKWVATGYAALGVIGVGAIALWWRHINRQRAEAIAAMEARHAARSREQLRSGPRWSPSRTSGPARANAASSPSSSYDAPAPMPFSTDSWPSATPTESHHRSSFSGGGGTFDGGGSSGDWSSSSSDSSSSYSSPDSGSSSSDSGSSSSGDW